MYKLVGGHNNQPADIVLDDDVIPYGHQTISDDDIDAVVNVLRSDWLTQGPVIEQFESELADKCGAKYALAVCNGTAALHLACCALDLRAGDWLWTSPNTFVASANCARYCGAKVDFVDIDTKTYNMDIGLLEEKLKLAKQQDRLPKIVVAVHFAGQSVEMEGLYSLSRQYGFYIIEDACHALGGCYKNHPIGQGQYSDITVFSFHPVKLITTGEGGAVLTNKAEIFERIKLLRSHGITRDTTHMKANLIGSWSYEQLELGFNYRMSDLHAALGCSQLTRLDEFVSRRQELAQFYNAALENLPVIRPWQHPDTTSSWHLYVIQLNGEKTTKTRAQIFSGMRTAGIGVNVHYIPVHTQPYYQSLGFRKGDFPYSEAYYEQALTLPMYPSLTAGQMNRVIETLKDLLT